MKCVDEGTQHSDRIVALIHGEPLKEEGALAVVICTLCDAPSKVVQEIDADLIIIIQIPF